MKGYVGNIEQKTLTNDYFREVLYTDERIQLVVMSLLPNEDIGEEVHDLDQFIRIESGSGTAILDGVEHAIAGGTAIVIPKGMLHNILNTSGTEPLKLYTLYAPPGHKDKLVHKTKADSIANDAPFDGVTSE